MNPIDALFAPWARPSYSETMTVFTGIIRAGSAMFETLVRDPNGAVAMFLEEMPGVPGMDLAELTKFLASTAEAAASDPAIRTDLVELLLLLRLSDTGEDRS